MVATPALHLDITQIGVMTSIFPLVSRSAAPRSLAHGSLLTPLPPRNLPQAYGFSKFVAGVLSARLSPTVMLAGGLMATALVNIAFGFGSSLAWFGAMWALNGILQGTGGPSCARILTNWFATKERGTYWQVLFFFSWLALNTDSGERRSPGLLALILEMLEADLGAHHLLQGPLEHLPQPRRVHGSAGGRDCRS